MHNTLSPSPSPCTPAATEGLGVGDPPARVGLAAALSCRPLSARHRKWWYRDWNRSLGPATFSTAPWGQMPHVSIYIGLPIHCQYMFVSPYIVNVCWSPHTLSMYVGLPIHCQCMFVSPYIVNICWSPHTLSMYVGLPIHCQCMFVSPYIVNICSSPHTLSMYVRLPIHYQCMFVSPYIVTLSSTPHKNPRYFAEVMSAV